MENNVDCIVLNYNDSKTTIKMVEQIQSYCILSHIIIVDNCSTDDSYEKLLRLENEKIIVIRTSQNGGYGAGNNFGVFYSREHFESKYALISNPDVVFSEACVAELVSIMDNDKQCAICAPVQLNAQGAIIQDYAWHLPNSWQSILSAGHYLRRVMWKPYGYDWLEAQRRESHRSQIVDCVPGAMLMVRTDMFGKISGYDEKNFLYWEEAMLSKKVKDCGFHSRLLVNQTYLHNHSVSINKSIPKAISRTKLLLQGRYHYLRYYTNTNGLQCLFAKAFFEVCILEQIFIAKVKNR